MRKHKNFWDKNAGRYDRSMRKDRAAYDEMYELIRQEVKAKTVLDYLKGHPNAAVVNLGCGLDSTGRACDNGNCKIYNLDYSDVITVRNELLPVGEREENIPCDLNNTEWFRKIDASNCAVFLHTLGDYFLPFLKERM